jgi:hypothetical protein
LPTTLGNSGNLREFKTLLEIYWNFVNPSGNFSRMDHDR